MGVVFDGTVKALLDRLTTVEGILGVGGPGSATSATVIATGSMTARNLGDRAADVVNVKDYGATLDGTTDDYAAFAAAHTALPSTGGVIIVPPGSPLLGSTWVISKRCIIVGSGRAEVNTASGTTIKKASTLNGKAIQVTGPATTLRDFTLQGIAGNGGDGISIEAHGVKLENVAVYAMGQDGIRVGTDAGVNANMWRLEFVKAMSNGRHGIYISDKAAPTLPDANAGTAVHLELQSNTSDGLRVGNAIGNTFLGTQAETNGEYGVYLLGAGTTVAQRNSFYGGDIDESNVTRDLQIDAGALSNQFYGVRVTQARTQNLEPTTLILGPGDADPGQYLLGVFDIQMPRADINYVRVNRAGGGIDFVTNGAAASDANAILRLKSTNVAEFPQSGGVNITGNVTAPAIFAPSGSSSYIKGQMADGVSAIGTRLGSATALSTAGAKLASVQNTTTEKAFVGFDGVGNFSGGLAPGTDGLAAQTGNRIFMGTGVPNNANGSNGDVYFRIDTPGTANQRLYVKAAGSWTGIL